MTRAVPVRLYTGIAPLDVRVVTAIYIEYTNKTHTILLISLRIRAYDDIKNLSSNGLAHAKDAKEADHSLSGVDMLRCPSTVVIETLLEYEWPMLSISNIFAMFPLPATFEHIAYFTPALSTEQ